MKKTKTKIVLDADVVIHFIESKYLSKLYLIYPAYQYVILDIVLEKELCCKETKDYINRYLTAFPNHIKVENWFPAGEVLKEYAKLLKVYGLGESASMAYCKFNNNVIASSNIRDVKSYCEDNQITYLTTMDLLWEAYTSKIMTEDECNDFIANVLATDSKLPVSKITFYKPRQIIL